MGSIDPFGFLFHRKKGEEMIVFDETGEVIEDYDLEKGQVTTEHKDVMHRWIVDNPEEGEWETIAEYPETGGRDVEWKVTSEEVGHWETIDADTEEPIEHFDGVIADDWPHDHPVEDVFEYGIYRPYTPEELVERDKQNADRVAAQAANAQMMRAVSMSVMALNLTDEQALSISSVFPKWTVGTSYKIGDIVRWDGDLYGALQDSTAEEQYTPDVYASGWKKVGEPNGEGILPWSQPLGATDAYMSGDKVTHGGKTWTSAVDYNVWEPGVYGWDADGDVEEASEWIQPTGAHDAYQIGDKVMHDGHIWESTVDGNVWEPGVAGAPWKDLGEADAA